MRILLSTSAPSRAHAYSDGRQRFRQELIKETQKEECGARNAGQPTLTINWNRHTTCLDGYMTNGIKHETPHMYRCINRQNEWSRGIFSSSRSIVDTSTGRTIDKTYKLSHQAYHQRHDQKIRNKTRVQDHMPRKKEK